MAPNSDALRELNLAHAARVRTLRHQVASDRDAFNGRIEAFPDLFRAFECTPSGIKSEGIYYKILRDSEG